MVNSDDDEVARKDALYNVLMSQKEILKQSKKDAIKRSQVRESIKQKKERNKQLLELLTDDHRNFLNDILTLIYNVNSIPNKIKFKVLDIQDMIKTFEKNKKIETNTYMKKLPFNARTCSLSFLSWLSI